MNTRFFHRIGIIVSARRITRILSILALIIGSCLPWSCTRDKPAGLNIILVVADDLGWRDVSYNDNPYFSTPNIDALAGKGVVFRQAYANAPNCAPTRAALLSGLYAPGTGIYTVASSERGKANERKLIPVQNTTVLDTSFTTLPEILQSAGYRTAHFGKWHLGDGHAGPEGQGFEFNFGGDHRGHPASYFSPYQNPRIQDGPEGEYLTDRIGREVIDYIRGVQNEKFFVYLPFYAVHTPIQPKKEMVEKYRYKSSPLSKFDPRYAAMVENMDRNIGLIMDSLENFGLHDRTLVIFMSDNGPYYPVSSAEPLRGSKGQLYEGGIRVPLIVHHPDMPNRITDQYALTFDLFPTILELAGINPGRSVKPDGISLVPALEGMNLEERDLFWHFPAYLANYRGMEGKWRITPSAAMRSGPWKLIERFEDSSLELYNLESDLSEQHNLADSMPGKTQELYQRMLKWRKDRSAPVPTELNPLYDPS